MSEHDSGKSGAATAAQSNDGFNVIYQQRLVTTNPKQTTAQPKRESPFGTSGLSKRPEIQQQFAAHSNHLLDGNTLKLHHANYGQSFQQYQNSSAPVPVVVADGASHNFAKSATEVLDEDISSYRGAMSKTHNSHERASTENSRQSQHWGIVNLPSSNTENNSLRNFTNQIDMDNMKLWPQHVQPSSNGFKNVPYGMEYRNDTGDEIQLPGKCVNSNSRNHTILNNFTHLNTAPTVKQIIDYTQLVQPTPFQQRHVALNYVSDRFMNSSHINSSGIIQQRQAMQQNQALQRNHALQQSQVLLQTQLQPQLHHSQELESFNSIITDGNSMPNKFITRNSSNNYKNDYQIYSFTDKSESKDSDEIFKKTKEKIDFNMNGQINLYDGESSVVRNDVKVRSSEKESARKPPKVHSHQNCADDSESPKGWNSTIMNKDKGQDKYLKKRSVTDCQKNIPDDESTQKNLQIESLNSFDEESDFTQDNSDKRKPSLPTIKSENSTSFDESQQIDALSKCTWLQSSKKVLMSLIKLVEYDQRYNATKDTNTLLRFLFENQKDLIDLFPQSATDLLELDIASGDLTELAKDRGIDKQPQESFAPNSFFQKLINRGDLPKKPYLLSSSMENVTIATIEDGKIISICTADSNSGKVVKCKCCYFRSIEEWVTSFSIDKSENWKDIWKRVLIQVPLLKGKKNVWIVSHKKSGENDQCAFSPLYQYINAVDHTRFNVDEKVNHVEKKQNANGSEIPIECKVNDQSSIEPVTSLNMKASKKPENPFDSRNLTKTEIGKTGPKLLSGSNEKSNEDDLRSSEVEEKNRNKKDITALKLLNIDPHRAKSDLMFLTSTSVKEHPDKNQSIPQDSLDQDIFLEKREIPIGNSLRKKKMNKQILFHLSSRELLRSKLPREYPNAPLGEIWLSSKTFLPAINDGASLLGRKWVWDEGYYGDSEVTYEPNKRRSLDSKTPLNSRAYCACGVEDDRGEKLEGGRTRRSTGNSVKLGHVLTELASGKLNPHTLVSCEAYSLGPELNEFPISDDAGTDVLGKLIKEKGGPTQVQPFTVRVSPDAAFLADLHAHLAKCEVIGLLGGRWVPEEKCVYIQAAFPCKAADSGSTDVEMDPVSQVMARDAISAHGLKVVGWYHSHPTFQPDPSVTDIENQGNYQRLFTSIHTKGSSDKNKKKMIPFVGLIIGTWDGRNPSPRSVMRWFHVTPKETGNLKSIKNQTSGGNANVDFSLSGGAAKERVLFPMKLEVTHRHFRWENSERERLELTSSGTKQRLKRKMSRLDKLRKEKRGEIEMWKNVKPVANVKSKKDKMKNSSKICQVIPEDTENVSPHPTENIRDSMPSQKKTKLVDIPSNEVSEKSCEEFTSIIKKKVPSDPLKAFIFGGFITLKSIDHQMNSKHPPHLSLYNVDKESKTRSLKQVFLHSELIQKGKEDCDIPDQVETRKKMNHSDPDANMPASPLPFSMEEFNLLNGEDFIDDEEISRIIWEAVEREQCSKLDIDEKEKSWVAHNVHRSAPASSHSILQLLLQNYWFFLSEKPEGNCDGKEKGSKYTDDDITIIHCIDALFSHYASNGKRIDISDLWSCSGSSSGNYGTNGGHNGLLNGSSAKMPKGRKICASLLRWTKSMQLSGFQSNSLLSSPELGVLNEKETNEMMQFVDEEKGKNLICVGDTPAGTAINYRKGSLSNFPRWDHETINENTTFVRGNGSLYSAKKSEGEFTRQKTPIQFTAEIMRLLAARWREAGGPPSIQKSKKRRGRPRKFL